MGSLVRERSTMRILPSLLLGLSTAQDESDFKVIEQTWDDVNKVDIWHDVEESEANLGDDVFYTPCQAQRYNAKGFNITNDLILPGSGYDPSCEGLDEPAIPGALVQNVPRWTNNFTGGKYEVAYFFTSDLTTTARTRFDPSLPSLSATRASSWSRWTTRTTRSTRTSWRFSRTWVARLMSVAISSTKC